MSIFKDLKPLGEEYYFMLMRQPEVKWTLKRQKRLMWVYAFCAFGFGIFFPFPGVYFHVIEPLYYTLVSYIIIGLTAGYFLLACVFSFGKTLAKHYRLHLFVRLYGALLMQLAIWSFFLSIGSAMNDAAIFYFLFFLLLLVIVVVANIMVLFRMAEQIKFGAYKRGGGGFFGILDRPIDGKKESEFKTFLKVYKTQLNKALTILCATLYGIGLLVHIHTDLFGGSSSNSFDLDSNAAILIFVWLLLLALFLLMSFGSGTILIELHIYNKFGFRRLFTDVDYEIIDKNAEDETAIEKDEQ